MKFTPQSARLELEKRSVLNGIANSASQPRSVTWLRTSHTPSQSTLKDEALLRPVGPRTEERLVEPPGIEPTPLALEGVPRVGTLPPPLWPAFVTWPSNSMPRGFVPKTKAFC